MFKDCKTGGYNLEGSQASPDRIVRLIQKEVSMFPASNSSRIYATPFCGLNFWR
jgi:hypothetical protein